MALVPAFPVPGQIRYALSRDQDFPVELRCHCVMELQNDDADESDESVKSSDLNEPRSTLGGGEKSI